MKKARKRIPAKSYTIFGQLVPPMRNKPKATPYKALRKLLAAVPPNRRFVVIGIVTVDKKGK